MESKQLALLCREYADNKKAENIAVLDMAEISSITDYFVIASGATEPHLRAISDEIRDKLQKEHNIQPRAIDGSLQAAWIVLDYFDVIVHVMRSDLRQRYDLESLWGDAKPLKPPRRAAGKAGKGQAKAPSSKGSSKPSSP